MSKHALLIEDEPNIIEAIRFILSRDGWRVSTHETGNDAAAVIARTAPDIVILDVMLPGRSGYEILDDLRADAATRDLPVLILTARGQERDRRLAELAGASRFMTKPFSNSEVLAAMHEMVGP